jgi:raffinose/stachyose/melibiose transport system permease protein
VNGDRRWPLPIVPGHEAAGVVAETGPEVASVAPGDRVALIFLTQCGTCARCVEGKSYLCERGTLANREGRLITGGPRLRSSEGAIHHHMGLAAFAEYALVSEKSLVKIPPDLDFVQASLFDWDGISALTNFVGLANYQRLFFDDEIFASSLRNTIVWTAMYVAIPTLIGLGVAILVDSKVRGESVFKGIIFTPWALSSVVVGFIWAWMYNPVGGLVNGFFRTIGLDFLAQPWLANPDLALPAINIAASWVRTGFAMILFLAGLRGIPSEIIQAATIDGAGRWAAIWHIVLPLLGPSFTVVIGTGFMLSIGAFDEVWVMTKGGPGFSSYLFSTYLYALTFQTHQAGLGAAIGVVMFALSAIGGSFYVRQMISREVSY